MHSEADDDIDRVEETDGAMVTNVNLGGEFTKGLLVVQDGSNDPQVKDAEEEGRDNSDSKFVEWGVIADEQDLMINTQQAVRP